MKPILRHTLLMVPFALLWSIANATEAELQRQIERCDRMLAVGTNESGYAEAISTAKRVRDLGVEKSDRASEARGLSRMALVQLTFAKWGDEWEGWLDRAEELTEQLKSPSIARAEFLMADGYLKAMYLGSVREGIEELEAAVVVAKALEADVLFAQVFRRLATVVKFDGQGHATEPMLYRSALFAARAEDAAEEFASRYLLLLIQHRNFRGADQINRERVRELASVLGLSVKAATVDSQEEFLRRSLDLVKRHEPLLDAEDTAQPHSIGALLRAAGMLAYHYATQHQWEASQRHLDIARRAAMLLQDATSLRSLLEHEAALLAKDGMGERALRVIQPVVEDLERNNGSVRLASIYQRLATFLELGGDRDSAITCLKLAAQSREQQRLDSITLDRRAAADYVEDIVQTRELTRKVRTREKELDRTLFTTRLLLFSLPPMLACGYLLQRSRRQQATERKLQTQVAEQTASLRQAKEEAEAANRAKTDYIARINHELRNPLAAILSSIELFSDADGPELEEMRKTIQSCSVNLLDTVDDVLDFTRIESGKLELQERDFAPTQLLQVVSDIVKPRMTTDTDLEIKVDANVPGWVRADESKLRQILVNLGQNAARHTIDGTIRVQCSRAISGTKGATLRPDQCLLVFSVTDTGCGIPASQLASIFAEFRSSQTRQGTGLGLYIASAFTALLGGELSCRSTEGRDAVFEVTLPVTLVQKVPVDPTPRAAEPQASQGVVLVIDDNEQVATAVTRLLRHLGHESHHVQTWGDAVPILQSGVDLVLMDLRMPEISGFECLTKIRRLDLTPEPRVIAMTGDATSTTRQQAADSGFDGFLAKPFTLKSLREALDEMKAERVTANESVPV